MTSLSVSPRARFKALDDEYFRPLIHLDDDVDIEDVSIDPETFIPKCRQLASLYGECMRSEVARIRDMIAAADMKNEHVPIPLLTESLAIEDVSISIFLHEGFYDTCEQFDLNRGQPVMSSVDPGEDPRPLCFMNFFSVKTTRSKSS